MLWFWSTYGTHQEHTCTPCPSISCTIEAIQSQFENPSQVLCKQLLSGDEIRRGRIGARTLRNRRDGNSPVVIGLDRADHNRPTRIMRLLDTSSLDLISFPDDVIPPYAILSHTWGDNQEEVNFQELHELNSARQCDSEALARHAVALKKGVSKIRSAAALALFHGFCFV